MAANLVAYMKIYTVLRGMHYCMKLMLAGFYFTGIETLALQNVGGSFNI